MPKCKICGEAVQSGEVMHVECREKWEAEMQAREDEAQKRRISLDIREKVLDAREKEADERGEKLLRCEKLLEEREEILDEAFGDAEKAIRQAQLMFILASTVTVIAIITIII